MNTIKVKNRSLNRKPRELRKIGMVPGTLYGPGVPTTPIKMGAFELEKMLARDGEIYQVKSPSGNVMVKFGDIQREPVSQELLHFSLVQLPRGEKNEVEVPIDITGTPEGVKKGGVLVVLKDNIPVEGMPSKIPEMLTGDVSDLDIGDSLKVRDLKIPKPIDVSIEDSEVVAICRPPAKVTKLNDEIENESVDLMPSQETSSPAAVI